METVEPIRDKNHIKAIKINLRSKKNPRDYLLFVMGINCGLRASDLLKLKIKDLFRNGRVLDCFYIRMKKTNKELKIDINDSMKGALNYYYEKADIKSNDEYLFKSERSDKPLERVRMHQLINQWVQDIELDIKAGCHTLRKTFGYQARMKGKSIDIIQKALGHRTQEVTKRYIGITDDEVKSLIMNLNL
ncbi:MAG: tyrosine-type recombinase/integrase [Candidatus Helarchaeota archaeon]|nr:tyrosine-type recombinase/integrase [Candidatus Helarchaeota archaeon]